MNRLRIALPLAGLALFVSACGTNDVTPPQNADPPRKQAAQSEPLPSDAPEPPKPVEPPYPAKAEEPLEPPAGPPPVNLEHQATLLAEEPLTISPEDRLAVEQMEEELARSDALLREEGSQPDDGGLADDLSRGGELPDDEALLLSIADEDDLTIAEAYEPYADEDFLLSGDEYDLDDPADVEALLREEFGDAPAGGEEPLVAGIQTYTGTLADLSEMEIVYFQFDLANLSGEAMAELDKNIVWLKTNPDLRVRVEGHCDERGTSEYNLALGQRRAGRVVDYLIANGVNADRLIAVSFGEEIPRSFDHTEEAWKKNRRVEFSPAEGEPGDGLSQTLADQPTP